METEATSSRMVAERWSYKPWLHRLRGGMLVGRGDAGEDVGGRGCWWGMGCWWRGECWHPVGRDTAGSTRPKKVLCSGIHISASLLPPKCKYTQEPSPCGVLPQSNLLMVLELVRLADTWKQKSYLGLVLRKGSALSRGDVSETNCLFYRFSWANFHAAPQLGLFRIRSIYSAPSLSLTNVDCLITLAPGFAFLTNWAEPNPHKLQYSSECSW